MKTNQLNLFSPVIPVYLLNFTFKIMTLRSKRVTKVKLKALT